MISMTENKKLATLQEVAAYLNKSNAQVHRYIQQGLLHPEKIGKRNMFDEREVKTLKASWGGRVIEEQKEEKPSNEAHTIQPSELAQLIGEGMAAFFKTMGSEVKIEHIPFSLKK